MLKDKTSDVLFFFFFLLFLTKAKTNNVFVMSYYFPTSTSVSPTGNLSLSDRSKHMQTFLLTQLVTSKYTQIGVNCAFVVGALPSIYGSRSVYVGLTQNPLHALSQRNNVVHLCGSE